MPGVCIAGVGMTPFGEYPDRTSRELFSEAAHEALSDATLSPESIEEIFYANFVGEVTETQGHQGPLMAAAVGVKTPVTRIESACASGGVAVRQAATKIRSGEADIVLVGGMEKLTHLDTNTATKALALAADERWEIRGGVTFPGAYALMANRYMAQFGAERSDFAHVAVKNHENAVNNPLAQYRSEITVQEVLAAPMISSPIGLYDACPVTDGASTIILVSDELAESADLDVTVKITGTGHATDSLSLQSRESICRTPATAVAADRAFEMAGKDRKDVDFAEVHDCFTIAEVLAIESLGFYETGTGYRAAHNGETTAGGALPVNLSGGLKAKGHPVGATGVAQIVEVSKLLAGEHPNSSAVPDATVGLAHNAGGTVASATATIVEHYDN